MRPSRKNLSQGGDQGGRKEGGFGQEGSGEVSLQERRWGCPPGSATLESSRAKERLLREKRTGQAVDLLKRARDSELRNRRDEGKRTYINDTF